MEHRSASDDLTVELPCGIVRCQVDGEMVTVQMGHASFESADIPATESMIFSPKPVGEAMLPLTAVGVGNLCVVFWGQSSMAYRGARAQSWKQPALPQPHQRAVRAGD